MAYLYGLQEGVADELGAFMSIALEVSGVGNLFSISLIIRVIALYSIT